MLKITQETGTYFHFTSYGSSADKVYINHKINLVLKSLRSVRRLFFSCNTCFKKLDRAPLVLRRENWDYLRFCNVLPNMLTKESKRRHRSRGVDSRQDSFIFKNIPSWCIHVACIEFLDCPIGRTSIFLLMTRVQIAIFWRSITSRKLLSVSTLTWPRRYIVLCSREHLSTCYNDFYSVSPIWSFASRAVYEERWILAVPLYKKYRTESP